MHPWLRANNDDTICLNKVATEPHLIKLHSLFISLDANLVLLPLTADQTMKKQNHNETSSELVENFTMSSSSLLRYLSNSTVVKLILSLNFFVRARRTPRRPTHTEHISIFRWTRDAFSAALYPKSKTTMSSDHKQMKCISNNAE